MLQDLVHPPLRLQRLALREIRGGNGHLLGLLLLLLLIFCCCSSFFLVLVFVLVLLHLLTL